MREKNKIILLTHGPWGKALVKSMGMLVGKTENITCIELKPDMTLDQYIKEVEENSVPIDKNTIVLTDIPGATTSNVALRLTKKYPWNIISGVNSLMLVETIMHQNEEITDDVLKKILEAGHNSQKHLKVKVI